MLLCWNTLHLKTTEFWVVGGCVWAAMNNDCIATAVLCHATAQTCSSTLDAILKPNMCLKQTSKLLLQCQFVLTVWRNRCMDLKVFTCAASRAPVWFPGLSFPTVTCSDDC